MELTDLAHAATTAGALEDAHALAEKASGRATDAYDQIRQEPGRTEDWVEEQMAKAYIQVRADLTKDLQKLVDTTTTTYRADEQSVFGAAGMDGDSASLAISRRDAGDRVASILAEDELDALLARAERGGDEPLARAVVERAYELGYPGLVNKFLERRPNLDDAATRLWDARFPDSNREFSFWMTMESTKPSELRNLSEERIAGIANRGVQASRSPESRSSFQATVIAELGLA